MTVSSSLFNSVTNQPFRPQYPSVTLNFTEMKRKYPTGVDVVVVVPTTTPGWSEVSNSRGIIAVLIGLLPPGQEKGHDISILPAGLLRTGGKFGVSTSLNFVFHNITWS